MLITVEVLIKMLIQRFVRDRRASYQQSMSVLEHAKQYKPGLMTKTSLMLGHGETDEQVMKTMQGCVISCGYLALVSFQSVVGYVIWLIRSL